MQPSLHIVLAEPSTVDNLYPFSVLHCAWEVRCGALRLVDKLAQLFPDAALSFIVASGREAHLRSFLAREGRSNAVPDGGAVLVLFSSILPTAALRDSVREAFDRTTPTVFTVGGKRVGAYVPSMPEYADLSGLAEFDSPLHTDAVEQAVEAQTITWLWDALALNAGAIDHDAQFFSQRTTSFADGVVCVERNNIFTGDNVVVGPCCVLDASEGPIILGDNVRIMPQSTLLGPCVVGDNSLIKIGAKIYGETSIGPWCKVGGEVENSIIHAYSNKQHDGFLGHSYLGEWVNLGADTNTSDLKNNYGTIRTRLRSTEIDTGRMFLGLLCGDHSKSGINTMFNTGTTAGVSANIFGGDFPPKSIPSFSWGGRDGAPVFDLDKALELARTVMARRKRTLLPEEEELLRSEFARVTS